ncbi:hypothetical protein DW352_21680 [Pseudolabrys taiwanensis]|uniref:Uncharacterized protein n=1 Tax=Pseudolabrys taiwanensis TaxID=331696 RepID=A0A346A153_9HYPH|nr:hypothetical protein DW352_21680 [Pseudolabrys taiwanensis]
MALNLNDPSLLRPSCLIDGEWGGAGCDAVSNPATTVVLANVPSLVIIAAGKFHGVTIGVVAAHVAKLSEDHPLDGSTSARTVGSTQSGNAREESRHGIAEYLDDKYDLMSGFWCGAVFAPLKSSTLNSIDVFC